MSFGFALGADWRFKTSQNCWILTRINGRATEPVHLNIVWKRSDTGEIDVHLTFDHESKMSGMVDVKKRLDLWRIHPEQARQFADAASTLVREFEARMIHRYRRFRPGWLKRNGYAIVFADGKKIFEAFRAQVPKRRKKFRLSSGILGEMERQAQSLDLASYCPSGLHILAPLVRECPEIQVAALSPHGRSSLAQMPLKYVPGRGWYGIPSDELFGIILSTLPEWGALFRPLAAADAREKIESLIGELEMDDLPYLARCLAKLRKWLHSAGAEPDAASGE